MQHTSSQPAHTSNGRNRNNWHVFLFISFFYVISQLIKDIMDRFNRANKSILNFRIFFLYSFFLTLWPLAPSGNLFNNWLSIIFFYPLGFYLYFSKHKQ